MQREGFNSKLGSILALAGSAVGLGNIWRFPYMLSEYGGGTFLPVYIMCVLIISVPIMICEFILGRRSQRTAYGSIARLTKSKIWAASGFLFVLIPTITVSYYSVIGGWTLDYFIKSATMQFSGATPEAIESMFGALVSNSWLPLAFHLVFLLGTCVIIGFGVKKGIEGFSKVMMPLLFILMVIIAIRSVTLPGAMEGIKYLFRPDWDKITPDMFIAALGQAFFSLSIGMGIMLTYGSYIPKKANLASTALSTAFFDLLFAIIAGCAVIPAMFAFDMEAVQGAGLVFQTLPSVFAQMPLGSLVALVFFFAVILAAMTSAMSLFEVPVSYLVEKYGMKRPLACVIVFVLTFSLGALCSLSFGALSHIQITGKNIFDFCDFFTANYLMPFAGLIIVLFVGWKMPKPDVRDEYTNGGSLNLGRKNLFWLIYFAIKYVAPVGIIAIFISGLL